MFLLRHASTVLTQPCSFLLLMDSLGIMSGITQCSTTYLCIWDVSQFNIHESLWSLGWRTTHLREAVGKFLRQGRITQAGIKFLCSCGWPWTLPPLPSVLCHQHLAFLFLSVCVSMCLCALHMCGWPWRPKKDVGTRPGVISSCKLWMWMLGTELCNWVCLTAELAPAPGYCVFKGVCFFLRVRTMAQSSTMLALWAGGSEFGPQHTHQSKAWSPCLITLAPGRNEGGGSLASLASQPSQSMSSSHRQSNWQQVTMTSGPHTFVKVYIQISFHIHQILYIFFAVLGLEPEACWMLGKPCTIEPQPQPCLFIVPVWHLYDNWSYITL